MILVLDSNEYINYLEKKSKILNEIFANEEITICINEVIVKETLRNIDERKSKEFYSLLYRHKIVAYNKKSPNKQKHNKEHNDFHFSSSLILYFLSFGFCPSTTLSNLFCSLLSTSQPLQHFLSNS